jgi:hypothetical protein
VEHGSSKPTDRELESLLSTFRSSRRHLIDAYGPLWAAQVRRALHPMYRAPKRDVTDQAATVFKRGCLPLKVFDGKSTRTFRSEPYSLEVFRHDLPAKRSSCGAH